MIRALSMILALLGASPVFAANPASTVRSLAGCFQVTYRYVEDGTHDQTLDDEFYEWIDTRESAGVMNFQHFGVEGSHASKHWLETWSEVHPGLWTQSVYDGSSHALRYACEAAFTLNQWRCRTANAPKPRRDSGRTDYATLDRENTLQITPQGFVQVENNLKRAADGSAVATEVGWNEYKRVDEAKCAPARGMPW